MTDLKKATRDWLTLINNPSAEVYEVKRTSLQNSAMWKAYRLLAQEFLDRGLDMEVVLSEAKMPIPWTPEAVHEVIFNGISKAMFNTTSSGLDTHQPSQVWEQVQRFTRSNWDFEVPWPSEDEEAA